MAFPAAQRSERPRTAVQEVDLSIAQNSFVSIVGPSGCGKSTLLNVVSGLIGPSRGTVRCLGEPVSGVDLRVGYVTQDSNLLPWLTVMANVALPLKFAGVADKKEREQRARFWLERVGLSAWADHYPRQLSGGMQRRCAIARSFIYGPQVLLMDEPFGAVDAMTRVVLQQELLDLWEREPKTILFVTHDLGEAIALSDAVVVMTGAPGRVRAVVDVELKRPRNVAGVVEEAEFAELHNRLRAYLEEDPGWSNQRQVTSQEQECQ